MQYSQSIPMMRSPRRKARMFRRPKDRGTSLITHVLVGFLVFVVGVAVLGSIVLSFAPSDTPPQPSDLVQQFRDVAKGTAHARHVYGGPLALVQKGGKIAVMAARVPPSACVSAGWSLAREGILAVNDLTPPRISAGILAELCNRAGDLATMTWTPKG